MIIPTDRPHYESAIATYWMDDAGFLVSLSKPVLRTVDNIGENVALVKRITGNKPVPLLIYLKPSPIPDRATQRFSTEQLPQIYSAMAMVSAPGLSKFIMNLLFALKTPPIPMKGFGNEADARAWLQQFVT
ncbi:MAG: STAS/SEC14 domain-containing protein [Lewinellaceae bacterium]|nr:STAS/SEC14 domain-containing protein [Lewinellaceae bacterium]